MNRDFELVRSTTKLEARRKLARAIPELELMGYDLRKLGLHRDVARLADMVASLHEISAHLK